VSGRAHIRYAGSPLPLSFSEFEDRKSVYLVEFSGNRLENVAPLEVPPAAGWCACGGR
jgi:exonuclease SbcD